MANFDPNSWYKINRRGQQSMVGSGLFDQGKGAVFFTGTNTSDPQQQWQIFPYNATYYVLRTNASGKFGYMGASVGTNESTPGDTVPTMRNVTLSDASMFWTIDPWGDGKFYMTNAANGSDWHLNVKLNDLLSMSSNITAPQIGQMFSFTKEGSIDQPGFSSVALPSMTSTSTSTSTSTPTSITISVPTPTSSGHPIESSSSSSGLSTGAKAGIGAGFAVIALIMFVAFGFWLVRRRKRRSQLQSQSQLQMQFQPPMSAPEIKKDVIRAPQELDPADVSRYEMEAGKRGQRRSVSPYRRGIDNEQKAIMPVGFFRENLVHEMDSTPRPAGRTELAGEERRGG